MSLNAQALRLLAEKGLTASDIAELAEALEVRPAEDATAADRQRNYRARKDVTEAEWSHLRAQVFERDGHLCTYCGGNDRIACDHIVPLIQGGRSTLDNLTTACKPCNSGKGGRTPKEWLR